MTSYQGQTSKSTRTMVKPILRKLTQSEKNSLDLDRPAEQRDAFGIYGNGTGNLSSHDVSFNQSGRRGYHARSTSGTSQFSTATTGSGARVGSFIHPFQQTPRPYTPPLATTSYQTSLRESEYSHTNSPALTEDEDHLRQTFRTNSNLSNGATSYTGNTSSVVGSQPLRIQTKQLTSSRLARETSKVSLSDSLPLSPDITSPVGSPNDTMSPASAITQGFRIRSRSDIDTRGHPELIQEARRKFHEKELAEEEKIAREEIRALEKRNQKEARAIEKGHRRSSASDGTRSKRSKSDLTMQEKDAFFTRKYDGAPYETSYQEEEFEEPRRSQTGFSNTKHKTHNLVTKFMMWCRTRLLRMGGKKNRSQDGI